MNSTLKPVVGQSGVSGQPSPAKGNVAGVNHAPAHPQAAQNSHHPTNNLVGQNLTQAQGAAGQAGHAAPPMAPVSANMAQMAQNMSHHGNLSHVTQNAVAAPKVTSPSKPAPAAPLSLVQDKQANGSQPLALTRTLDKKEPDSTVQANGTVESPKPVVHATSPLKATNAEGNKDKLDIAKTSPSTPKPPEQPVNPPSTPQKPETPNAVGQAEVPSQPKVATANEAPEKSPSKPLEPKPTPTADVAPKQSDNKLVPESAKDSQSKATTPLKVDQPAAVESAKIVNTPKVEDKKEEPKVEASPQKPEVNIEQSKTDKAEAVKVEEPTQKQVDKIEKPLEKVEKPVEKVDKLVDKPEEKKPEKAEEKKNPAKLEPKVAPKSTLKLATVSTPVRKRRHTSPNKSETATPAKTPGEDEGSRIKRNRTKVQLYQSPTPDIAMATKLSASAGRSTPTKQSDDSKLIVIYKNEYIAVRNAEGGFYVCQALQNVYRSTRKIKIRWLSQDKTADPSGETYKPDFYDTTDMECVLTTLSLARAPGGGGKGGQGAQLLRPQEEARVRSILRRAISAEAGSEVELTEEHPDGLDLSLYTDESQLEKKGRKRTSSKSSPRNRDDDDEKDEPTPAKKGRSAPKRSPKAAPAPTPSPARRAPAPSPQSKGSKGSAPQGAAPSKTATAVTEKAKTASKTTPVKPKEAAATPTRSGRRSVKESKPSPLVATPSTSTGKTTRTPRKPPTKK